MDELNNEINLLQLPNEIIYHIFSFIDAKSLNKCVSKVCLHFYHLLKDESNYWKMRLFKRFPNPYPIVKGEKFSWNEGCEARESAHLKWSSNDQSNVLKILNGPHFGYSINDVKFTQDGSLCFAACNDKTVMVWRTDEAKISDLELSSASTRYPQPCNLFGHKGWVWSLAVCNENMTMCSASFDSTVKLWDIEHVAKDSNNNMIKDSNSTVHVKSPGLCCTYLDKNVIAAGLHNKSTVLIDSRTSTVVQKYINHEKPVLCVEKQENVIITASEDKAINFLDYRTGEVLNSVTLDSFCMSLHCTEGQLWAGDRDGSIKVFDISSVSDVKHVEDFDSEHKGKITGVHYSKGAVYTCCMDGYFKVHEPTLNSDCIKSVNLNCGGITSLFVQDETVALGYARGMVAIWTPNSENK